MASLTYLCNGVVLCTCTWRSLLSGTPLSRSVPRGPPPSSPRSWAGTSRSRCRTSSCLRRPGSPRCRGPARRLGRSSRVPYEPLAGAGPGRSGGVTMKLDDPAGPCSHAWNLRALLAIFTLPSHPSCRPGRSGTSQLQPSCCLPSSFLPGTRPSTAATSASACSTLT